MSACAISGASRSMKPAPGPVPVNCTRVSPSVPILNSSRGCSSERAGASKSSRGPRRRINGRRPASVRPARGATGSAVLPRELLDRRLEVPLTVGSRHPCIGAQHWSFSWLLVGLALAVRPIMSPHRVRLFIVGLSLGGLSLGLGASAAQASPFGKLFGGGGDRHQAAMQGGQKVNITGWRKDLLKLRADAESGKKKFGDVFDKAKLFANIASG